jgi:hypothetical protein
MAFGIRRSQNGGVYVSVETLTTIIGIVSVLASFASAFAWLIRRMDARFDSFDAKFGARIDAVETRLTERIDGFETRLTERIDGVETRLTERIDGFETQLTARMTAVERELVEVKIAIARLEGPPPRLVPVR